MSSLTFYFDQKLIIVPIICFLYILLGQSSNFEKVLLLLHIFYAHYPIFIDRNMGWTMPSAQSRMMTLEIVNIGYAITIIAFYIFPFFIIKNINPKEILSALISKNNFVIIFFVIVYLIIFYMLFDNSTKWASGNGIFYKVSCYYFLVFFSKNFSNSYNFFFFSNFNFIF